MTLPSRLTLLLCASFAAFALVACSGDSESSAPSANTAPSSPEVDALNWSQIEVDGRINRYDGKTKIDITGHFLAAHNACAQEDAGGAYAIDFWNPFVTTFNTIVNGPLTGPEQCFENPYSDTMIDGNVLVTMTSGQTITLYYPQADQICSHIPDLTAAKNLFQSLNQALSTAGMEDCAHPI